MPYKRHNSIFLHGLWRSGSTYIWSKFREAPSTYCYYEPLHQGLGRLTRKRIARDTVEIVSDNRHPDLTAPYFAEFEPLLKPLKGVRNFYRRFAYRPYALPSTGENRALHTYIKSLIEYAHSMQKQPVLGFNRTNLRIGWLARNFESFNIYINRNPRDIWRSYKRHMDEGNYTYFTAWLMTLEQNRHHPVFAPLAKNIFLRAGLDLVLKKPKAWYREALQNMTPAESYAFVFYIWTACTLHALSHADMILDMDLLTESSYREKCMKIIQDQCGFAPDFSDARAAGRQKDSLDFDGLERQILKNFPLSSLPEFFDLEKIRPRLNEIAPDQMALLKKILL